MQATDSKKIKKNLSLIYLTRYWMSMDPIWIYMCNNSVTQSRSWVWDPPDPTSPAQHHPAHPQPDLHSLKHSVDWCVQWELVCKRGVLYDASTSLTILTDSFSTQLYKSTIFFIFPEVMGCKIYKQVFFVSFLIVIYFYFLLTLDVRFWNPLEVVKILVQYKYFLYFFLFFSFSCCSSRITHLSDKSAIFLIRQCFLFFLLRHYFFMSHQILIINTFFEFLRTFFTKIQFYLYFFGKYCIFTNQKKIKLGKKKITLIC
jgi:hypothetical protein